MAQLNDIQLHLNELEQGKHHFSFRLDDLFIQGLPANYGVDKSEITGCLIDAEANLNLRENDYSLHIAAKGSVQLVCDRCLATMSYPVDVEDDIWPYEDEQSTDTLDLAWLTYEMIIINLPLVHSHPDGECTPDMQQLLQAFGVPANKTEQDSSHLSSTAEPE